MPGSSLVVGESGMTMTFPNESAEYRAARNKLLEAEIGLRARVEEVAAQRRELPVGGAVPNDYVFQALDSAERVVESRMSDLFEEGKDTLLIYSFMFGPNMENACPACSSVIDALNANARPIQDSINLAVVARSPIERINAFAQLRGWERVPLYSAFENDYARDYRSETPEGSQLPMANVFRKIGGSVHHCWGTELLSAPSEGHPRHVDMIWPLWNVLDMTPAGRGDYLPSL